MTQGTLQRDQFPTTTTLNPGKWKVNSIQNRADQSPRFIQYCNEPVLKYQYFDIYFSQKNYQALESSRCLRFGGADDNNVDDDSSELEEHIYSHETPNHQET